MPIDWEKIEADLKTEPPDGLRNLFKSAGVRQRQLLKRFNDEQKFMRLCLAEKKRREKAARKEKQ